MIETFSRPVLTRPESLRVLVVLPLYGGSLPIGRYCVEALRDLGHTVEAFEAPAYYGAFTALRGLKTGMERLEQLESGFLNVISQAVYAQAERFEPDLVLSMAQAPLNRNMLQRFRKDGVLTAMWFVEDHTVFPYWRAFAPLYDLFFVIQKEPLATELANMGVRSVYLPMAALPSFHQPLPPDPADKRRYGSAVSFVGAGYPNRRLAFRQLMHLNSRDSREFRIWGSDWENETVLARFIQNNGARVSSEDCVRIFNASSINLNLHSGVKANELVTGGDFVNPRTFELAACEAFQLVDHRTLLPELFAPDELAVFHTMPELLEAMDHYLAHPEERSDMAKRARKRVLDEHTYQIRMGTLLEHTAKFAAERGSVFPARRDQTSTLDLLTAALPADLPESVRASLGPELRTLLQRLELGQGEPAFADVIARLRSQNGELTPLETTLLFLDEWRKQYGKKG